VTYHIPKYSKSQGNSSKDFPAEESLPEFRGTDFLLPVIHQSVALRELRLYFGNHLCAPPFTLTHFPELRALHCTPLVFCFIDAPKLEELHLLWSRSVESEHFNSLPLIEWVQAMLCSLITLDIYSNFDSRFHSDSDKGDMVFGQWILLLHSLQILTLGLRFASINGIIDHLWRNPKFSPKIDSFGYPNRWSNLRDCIEKRNHLAMKDPSVHPIHTLCFPLALH